MIPSITTEIEYIEHNYSSDAMGHMGGLINPRHWRGRFRSGICNTGGPPLPRKRAPTKKGWVPVQIFLGPPVVWLSFIRRFALVR